MEQKHVSDKISYAILHRMLYFICPFFGIRNIQICMEMSRTKNERKMFFYFELHEKVSNRRKCIHLECRNRNLNALYELQTDTGTVVRMHNIYWKK